MEILQNESYNVRLAKDGASGLSMLKKMSFDLCIFDIMVPKMDGFNLAHHLKAISPHTPFLFLTARVLKQDKIKGYKMGAEDYILKPFDQEELICKINVILRRNEAKEEKVKEPLEYKIGGYKFNIERMELTYKDKVTRMTEKESSVLKLLCLNKNRILRRDEAVKIIYGKYDYFLGRSFDVFISKIRKLLSQDDYVSIDNVYKVGFILNIKEPVTES